MNTNLKKLGTRNFNQLRIPNDYPEREKGMYRFEGFPGLRTKVEILKHYDGDRKVFAPDFCLHFMRNSEFEIN